jgi:hypothetical protein
MKNTIRRLKMLLKAVVGKELIIKPDIICAKERFGSN